MNEIVKNYRGILERIARAAEKAKRDARDITLIAVSKTYGAEYIHPLLDLGHQDFGENYVQEISEKWPSLKAEFSSARVHLIGPLQSNKTRAALGLCEVIHSLDRESLLVALGKEMNSEKMRGRAELELGAPGERRFFVQVNIGEEAQKAGVMPKDADDFITRARDVLPKDSLHGLMCIPPAREEAEKYFIQLREIAERNDLAKLSMGMSADFESAIVCGATHVRVGSAIFGERG